jgi:hypothetical protein
MSRTEKLVLEEYFKVDNLQQFVGMDEYGMFWKQIRGLTEMEWQGVKESDYHSVYEFMDSDTTDIQEVMDAVEQTIDEPIFYKVDYVDDGNLGYISVCKFRVEQRQGVEDG